MKKIATTRGEPPSRLIHARINELDAWRGKMLSRVRSLIKQSDPEVVGQWKWRGVPFLFIAALACIFSVARAAEEDHPVEDAARHKLQARADPSLPTLYLVGDSTMKNGTPGQRGWGEEMAQFFDPHAINVVNEAIGGRFEPDLPVRRPLGRRRGHAEERRLRHHPVRAQRPGPINDNFRAAAASRGSAKKHRKSITF